MMKIPKRDMLEISHDSRGYAAGCDTAGCPLHLWRYDVYPSKRAAWQDVTQWQTAHMRYCKNIERRLAVYRRIRARNPSPTPTNTPRKG